MPASRAHGWIVANGRRPAYPGLRDKLSELRYATAMANRMQRWAPQASRA
jgi:hypothetical protein